MRGKTSKKYRKLMQQYDLTFGFREPYQVLGALAVDSSFAIIQLKAKFIVDAQMIQDSDRFKMDLVGGLERTLHGKVKPSMRKRLGIECIEGGANHTLCVSDHPMLYTTSL
jgi:U3 small nucleolar RNA-associated protein 23